MLRDLSLVVDRAIRTGRVVALQHHELRALARLPSVVGNDQHFAELRQLLARVLDAEHGPTMTVLVMR
jgi:hypothetical protein